jgi:hypothetical protein
MIDVINAVNGDIFIARDDQFGSDYSYGGTRMVCSKTDNEEINRELTRLMRDESGLKNTLINRALRDGALNVLNKSEFPEDFLESRVGGGRCIIRPKSQQIAEIISSPNNEGFQETLGPIFQTIGNYLNASEGRIKLTPDFGRYSGLADMLYQYTQHSLGIRCEDGGCGGKSSYSTTGIIAVFESLQLQNRADTPLTLIGSAGAMGSEFLEYVRTLNFKNVAICDLHYDRVSTAGVPEGVTLLNAEEGRFTDECLRRGGIIVATTVGNELENSNWSLLPKGTVFLLAHNLAIPEGLAGLTLMETIHRQGVLAIPGQLLTLGGALTSRLEWFWRKANSGQGFNKPLAHSVVTAVISHLAQEILKISAAKAISPIQAMHKYMIT